MNLAGYDIALLNWLHGHLPPHAVPVLQFVSDTTTWVSIGLVLLVGILALANRSKQLLRHFIVLVAVLLLVAAASQGLKALIDRDRPFTTFPEIEKLSSGGDSSFPSGHTLEAFAVATALSLIFRRKPVFIPLFLWAMLVAWSRVALGVHYPSDVLAGMLIGGAVGWLGPFLGTKFRSDLNSAPPA